MSESSKRKINSFKAQITLSEEAKNDLVTVYKSKKKDGFLNPVTGVHIHDEKSMINHIEQMKKNIQRYKELKEILTIDELNNLFGAKNIEKYIQFDGKNIDEYIVHERTQFTIHIADEDDETEYDEEYTYDSIKELLEEHLDYFDFKLITS